MGEALLWALEEALGDDFTAPTRAAWISAYELIASSMLEGARRGVVGRAA